MRSKLTISHSQPIKSVLLIVLMGFCAYAIVNDEILEGTFRMLSCTTATNPTHFKEYLLLSGCLQQDASLYEPAHWNGF